MPTIPTTDLTQRPPRSVRVRLGGYVLLPRMLDKGRATLVEKNGEYHYNCPLDQHLVGFIGFDPAALLEQLKAGKSDGEILTWLNTHALNQRTPWEIAEWSRYQENRGPTDLEVREYFQSLHKQAAPDREDISSWADLLDLDDYVSFGGNA